MHCHTSLVPWMHPRKLNGYGADYAATKTGLYFFDILYAEKPLMLDKNIYKEYAGVVPIHRGVTPKEAIPKPFTA